MEDTAVSVLITDLDDTLIDWLRLWHDPFYVLIQALHESSGVPLAELKADFQRLHRRHRTSEASFLLPQLTTLQDRHPGEDIDNRYDEELHKYYSERERHFEAFPGVVETLTRIKESGSLIVIFTESLDFYANERVRKLGLDGLVDIMYSPPDHELPDDFTRHYSAEYYSLTSTDHRHLHAQFKKPDPNILMEILDECGALREQAIYVGDSEMKDIRMAQEAGVRDVLAAYGRGLGTEEYLLLQAVSHWTDDDMRREEELLAGGSVTPSHLLEKGFDELLDLFKFEAFVSPA